MTLPAVPPFVSGPLTPVPVPADRLRFADRIPGVRSSAMADHLDDLRQIRDVLGGIKTLRAGGELYLPKLTGESQDDYDFRLKLANFFNTPKRTVKAVAGMIAERDPIIGEDGDRDAEIRKHWESIDDRGNHGAVFVRRFAEDVTALGFAGILVDMPSFPAGRVMSAADAARLNLRPYWVPIRYEQINDVDWVMFGSQRVMVYLELRETVQRVVPGRAGKSPVERYRVYTREAEYFEDTDIVVNVGPPVLQIWETAPGGGSPERVGEAVVITNRGRTPHSRIPFTPCLAGDLETDDDVWVVRSPIQDQVDLSLTWYQVFAERRNLMNRVCTQTPWLKDYTPQMGTDGEPKPLRMGPSDAIILGANGAAGFLAPSADGFQPTRDELDDLERRQGVVGIVRLFFNGQVGKTVQGEQNESAPQFGILASIAGAVKDGVEGAVVDHAEYLNVQPPSVSVTKSFDHVLTDPTFIDAVTKLAASPRTTIETVLALLESWGALPNGFDVAAVVAKIKKLIPDGAPTPGTPGTPAAVDNSVVGRIRAAIAAKAAETATAPVPPAVATPPVAAA